MPLALPRRDFLLAAGVAALPAVGRAVPVAPPQFDVVVYGGVPCGIAAALAAARAGARTLLVEPTKHVGGLSTSGINTAETEHMLKWTIGGIALEFYERLGQHYGTGKPEFYFESSVAEKVYVAMLAEANVSVMYGVRVEKVERDGPRVTGVVLSDGTTVHAKVFVDAGYEGDLMARAGIAYTWGRESRAEFDEDAAGIRLDKTPRQAATVDDKGNLLPGITAWAKDLKEGDGDRKVMNYNFRLCGTTNADNMVPIPPPAAYDRGRYKLLENWLVGKAARNEKVAMRDFLGVYPRRHGKFEVNNQQNAIISLGHFGGQVGWPDGSYADRDRIFADHKEYTLGLLHFLRTETCVPKHIGDAVRAWGFAKDEFPDNGGFPYQLYVREARRMRGETVVTQKDVTTDRRKPDAVGISSHFVDCHHVQRVALSPTAFVNEGRIWRIGQAYHIPYRALTPKRAECANVLVPGAASFTHVAFCSYRLESVWMIAGHAAGLAAATAAKASVAVQDVDVPALQAALRKDKQVVDFVAGQPEKFPGGSGGFPEF